MNEINYNKELRGFVVREGGIPISEWLDFAESHSQLKKQESHFGVNPFTRKRTKFQDNNYLLVSRQHSVGLLCWEESECLGIAGDDPDLIAFTDTLCQTFGANYEPVQG